LVPPGATCEKATQLAKPMNQIATTLAAGLIVAACSWADYEPPDIAIAEREAAEDAYNDCVWRSVAGLDDGKSDRVWPEGNV